MGHVCKRLIKVKRLMKEERGRCGGKEGKLCDIYLVIAPLKSGNSGRCWRGVR